MAFNFVPLLAPANQMSYDTAQFYNSALAIVAGCGAAALSFRLLPPLSPALRTRRLLALTLRDLRRLATAPVLRTTDDWEGRMYGRLAALPDQAEPLQRAQLVAALSVGSEIIRFAACSRLGLAADLDAALAALAQGNSAIATARLPGSTTGSPPRPDAGPETATCSSGARQHPASSRRRLPSMPPISTQERPREVHRDRPVRRLRRADLVA